MSKLKKILLMGVSYALIAALAIGGTLAYLQDSDEAVNVMTLGNVSIEQHEYERATNADGTYKTANIDGVTSYVLKDFTQGKALLPIVGNPNGGYDPISVRMTQVGSYGGMSVLNVKNAVDKFVTVENTGKTDAYIRTLVAIEVGTAAPKLISFSNHFTWIDNQIGVVTIDNNNYYLHEFTYVGWKDGNRHVGGLLPAGDTSYPNLCQVYIKPEANNEDMVKLDGNGNGTLDILVVTQAIQAAGFADAETALNAAFGDITKTNHPWSTTAPKLPALVESFSELQSAISNGADEVIVKNADIEISGRPGVAGADITFSGGTVNNGTTGGFNKGIIDNGTLVYNNVTIVGSVSLYGEKVVFNNCTFDLTGICDYIWTYGAKEVEFNNCTFNTLGKAILVYNEGAVGSSVVTVNSCIFNATAPAFAGASSVQPCAAIEVDSSLIPGTYTINVVGENVIDSDFCGTVRVKAGSEKNNVTVNGVVPTDLVK